MYHIYLRTRLHFFALKRSFAHSLGVAAEFKDNLISLNFSAFGWKYFHQFTVLCFRLKFGALI